ncbi:hypothetical protein PSPO01_14478 [Paraphaeosphaeria sporulosa]
MILSTAKTEGWSSSYMVVRAAVTVLCAAGTLHRLLYYISGANLGFLETRSCRGVTVGDQLEGILNTTPAGKPSCFSTRHGPSSYRVTSGAAMARTTRSMSAPDTALITRLHVALKSERLSV